MHKIALEEPYADFIAARKSLDTKVAYAGELGRLRDATKIEPYAINDTELTAYFTALMKKGLADVTLNRVKASFFKFYRFLQTAKTSKYHRSDDPSLPLREISLKGHKANPKALTKEQREQVLKSLIWEGEKCDIHQMQISLAVFITFKTGLRRMEVAKLRWKDIDLKKKKFFSLRKGAKEFTGNISETLLEKLKEYQLFTGSIDTEWVFFNRANPSKHLSRGSIYDFFVVIRKRCGFGPDVRFSTHSGRHIFCTELFENDVADQVAIKMSGHESIEMFKKYCRIQDEEVKAEFNRAIK